MRRFDGKVAVITGSGRGIGLAIATAFAKEGSDLVVNVKNNVNELDEAVRKLRSEGHGVLGVQADVASWEDAGRLIKNAIEYFGRIDVLINNAGISRPAMCYKMTEADWDSVINVNLKGTFNCIRLIAPHMIDRKSGKIINISSVAGRDGMIGNINYSSSKAGIDGLTRTASKELARHGIKVNAVAPGFIMTQFTRWLEEPRFRDKYLPKIPLGRFGKPEEVASLVLFLASDESNYITGQIIAVDGGMFMT
jgi:3-oxoacyl-[acyl-carrier protein] reductase